MGQGLLGFTLLIDAACAESWFVTDWRKQAAAGDVNAQWQLGLALANGRGVEKNEAEAIQWIRKAAEQGEVTAQINLGIAYAQGDGVPQNLSEAYLWWQVASDLGNETATKNLKVIKKLMTAEQITQATRLARVQLKKLPKK